MMVVVGGGGHGALRTFGWEDTSVRHGQGVHLVDATTTTTLGHKHQRVLTDSEAQTGSPHGRQGRGGVRGGGGGGAEGPGGKQLASHW
jgi:hypothetical protein